MKQGLAASPRVAPLRLARWGAACVHLIVGMLHRNERGVPERAHNVLVKTSWHADAEPVAAAFAHR